MCRCPHSYPRHWKDVIGQLQAPAALFSEKMRYRLKGRLGRPQSQCVILEEENLSSLPGVEPWIDQPVV